MKAAAIPTEPELIAALATTALKTIRIESFVKKEHYYYKIHTTDINELCEVMYLDERIYKNIINIRENGDWTYFTCPSEEIKNLYIEMDTSRYYIWNLTDKLKQITCPSAKSDSWWRRHKRSYFHNELGAKKISRKTLIANKVTFTMFINIVKIFLGDFSRINDAGIEYTDSAIEFVPGSCTHSLGVDLQDYMPRESASGCMGEEGDFYFFIDKRKDCFVVHIWDCYAIFDYD